MPRSHLGSKSPKARERGQLLGSLNSFLTAAVVQGNRRVRKKDFPFAHVEDANQESRRTEGQVGDLGRAVRGRETLGRYEARGGREEDRGTGLGERERNGGAQRQRDAGRPVAAGRLTARPPRPRPARSRRAGAARTSPATRRAPPSSRGDGKWRRTAVPRKRGPGAPVPRVEEPSGVLLRELIAFCLSRALGQVTLSGLCYEKRSLYAPTLYTNIAYTHPFLILSDGEKAGRAGKPGAAPDTAALRGPQGAEQQQDEDCTTPAITEGEGAEQPAAGNCDKRRETGRDSEKGDAELGKRAAISYKRGPGGTRLQAAAERPLSAGLRRNSVRGGASAEVTRSPIGGLVGRR